MALLGRNGMGKTTLLRGLLGLVPVRTGSVKFDGTQLAGLATEVIVRSGIGYVPAGREYFRQSHACAKIC